MAHGRGCCLGCGNGLAVPLQDVSRDKRIGRIALDPLGKVPKPNLTPLDKAGASCDRARCRICEDLRPFNHGWQVQACGLGLALPTRQKGAPIGDGLLGAAGVEGSNLTGFKPRAAPRVEHFLAPRGEGHDLLTGKSRRLEIAVLADGPRRIAELFNRKPEARHRHAVKERVERPKLVVLQCSPFAIGTFCGVGDYGVEVEVGLLVAVGIVLEQRHGEVAGLYRAQLPVFDEARFGRVLFGPSQRLDDRFAIGFDDPLVAADEGENRPTLGQRESQVGPSAVRVFVADPGSVGVLAFEELVEDRSINFSGKAQRCGA